MDFRWNEWNLEHVTKHGVTTDEAEQIVTAAKPPFPESGGEDKLRVWGQATAGRYLQVVYILDPDGTVFIIHARPLTTAEKRRFKRR